MRCTHGSGRPSAPAAQIMVFFTANVSGGHLNPAVTAATMVTGHIGVIKGLGYILAQLSGGIMGLLLVVGPRLLLATAHGARRGGLRVYQGFAVLPPRVAPVWGPNKP